MNEQTLREKFNGVKKILKSVFTIVAVGAIVTGATMSFFSDTETSEGNTFTAGAIDLKVDSEAHYNGCVCDGTEWDCEPWADFVVEVDQGTRKDGGDVNSDRSDLAQALGEAESSGASYDNPVEAGTFFSLGFDGVIEIGFTNRIVNESGNDMKIYEVTGGSSYPDEIIQVEFSKDGLTWEDAVPLEITRDAEVDLGVLDWAKYVRITDVSDPADFSQENADGYDLDGLKALHCECEPEDLEGQECNSTWQLTDLGASHQFFKFEDIKPGDRGENTVSLHVLNNDAYACLLINNVESEEHDLIDPEDEAGDESEGEGELAKNLEFFAWEDDGDNIWEENEMPFFSPIVGKGEDLLNGKAYPLFTPQTMPLAAEQTEYLGLAWCAGTMDVDLGDNSITCDGTTVGNDAQTDSFSADLTFYVEQARNNSQFTCPELEE